MKCRVAVSDIPSSRTREDEAFLAALPQGLRAYAQKVENEGRRAERLSTMALLCRLLCLCDRGTDITLECDACGRPFIVGEGKLDFNLSHSGGLCACALAEGRVGIDIQEMSEKTDIHALAARFFTESEQAMIADAPDPCACFFSLWTQKEALGKYIGDGLVPYLRCDTARAYAERELTPFSYSLEHGGKRYLLTVCAHGRPDFIDFTNSKTDSI